jgi:hypothetical protein
MEITINGEFMWWALCAIVSCIFLIIKFINEIIYDDMLIRKFKLLRELNSYISDRNTKEILNFIDKFPELCLTYNGLINEIIYKYIGYKEESSNECKQIIDKLIESGYNINEMIANKFIPFGLDSKPLLFKLVDYYFDDDFNKNDMLNIIEHICENHNINMNLFYFDKNIIIYMLDKIK